MVPVREEAAGAGWRCSGGAVRGGTRLRRAPPLALGQASAGIAQGNTSVGKVNVMHGELQTPRGGAGNTCLQNWEWTRG